MTKDVSKMKYKEAQALYEDSSQDKELRSQAKDRMDSIRAWLKSKDSGGDNKPRGDRRAIEEKDFKNLESKQKSAIQEDTEVLLSAQLCRIFHIEQGLEERGIVGNGPFVGMLYNNQVATN